MDKRVKLFLEVLSSCKGFGKVGFVLLHGSVAERRALKDSDIDFCVYFEGDKRERASFRKKLLMELPSGFDVQIFQDLPLYVRKNVLRGEEVYVGDSNLMYEKAVETIKDYDLFRPKLMLYLG